MSKLIDMTGQDFGYWHVIKRAENSPRGEAYWLCQCGKCGIIKPVKGTHLRKGKTTQCKECSFKEIQQSKVLNEQGKIYGYLYVERRATEEEKPRNDKTGAYWVCTCKKCGKKNVVVFGDYLRKGNTQSCGCLRSTNEIKIANMLDVLSINYIKQQTFEKLKSATNYPLYFDFGIYNNNTLIYLIEYDGELHFNSNNRGWNTEENFEQQRQRDLIKNKYCFDNNIPLIRIPYDVKYDLNDLKLETTRFLLTPKNERAYYERS